MKFFYFTSTSWKPILGFVSVAKILCVANVFGQSDSRLRPFSGAQASSPYFSAPVTLEPTTKIAESCDPIWDGSLFGVLPGIALGGMFGIAGICGEHDSCAPYLIIGAVAGAGVGLLIDEVSCDQKKGGDAEALWPPARVASRIDSPAITMSVITANSVLPREEYKGN